jgi:peptide/nickel transport system substrate-binding protein
MHRWFVTWLGLLLVLALPALAQETPKRGGTLTFMIPADSPPSFDGHRENTFATIHAVAPFYSVLIRANPENPADTTQFVCDVCTAIPTPTDDGKTWTFPIRGDVKFSDGATLTAADVAASWNHIVDPPPGVISARQGYYSMIDKVEAPDAKTVVFHLKFATAAFLPALADPYAFIYKKEILDRDPHWYEKNVMGSGPFRFKEYLAGQSISGERNPDYYRPGLPYLDGFLGIFADKQAVRVSAIKSDRASIEFRGFPPATRDELVAALGDKITVQESDWNCGALITANHKRKPFDDARVRRALTLAIDRWGDSASMAQDYRLPHRRRDRVSRVAAGRDQGGTGTNRRLLARHRKIPRRGQAAAEGSRSRRAQWNDASGVDDDGLAGHGLGAAHGDHHVGAVVLVGGLLQQRADARAHIDHARAGDWLSRECPPAGPAPRS